MEKQNIISKAIKIAGIQEVASACGVTYQAVQGWRNRGCLPRTEWTGETNHHKHISKITGIAEADLLQRP